MFDFGYKGAGVLIYQVKGKDDVKVLLGRRLNNPDKGLWSIPGGAWEKKDIDTKGEPDLSETARREMCEETGFSLDKKNKKFLHNLWRMDVLGFKFNVFALRMVKMKMPKKHYEFSYMKWFDVNEIPDKAQCNRFLHQEVKELKQFLVKHGHLSAV